MSQINVSEKSRTGCVLSNRALYIAVVPAPGPGLVRSPPVPRKQGEGDHSAVRGGCHGCHGCLEGFGWGGA